MPVARNIEDDKHLWAALSELYLDTELQPYFFRQLAKNIYDSPYSYEDVREMDKAAIFPVLYGNLLNFTGVWDGFDKEWLFTSILKKKNKRNLLTRKYYNFVYFCMRGMFKKEWHQILSNLQELENED